MAAIVRCPRLDRVSVFSPVALGSFKAREVHQCSSSPTLLRSHSSAHSRRLRYSCSYLSSSLFGKADTAEALLCTARRRALSSSSSSSSSSSGLEVVCLQEVRELPVALQNIVKKFQMGGMPDNPQTQRLRYQQLLAYATKLKPLSKEYHVPENKVEGCVSQVWVLPRLEEGKVYFQADSDSQLVKGLAALLVEGLSGTTPDEVLRVEPDFIQLLGLKGSLTPSRNNGFLNLLKLMQKKTLQLYREEQEKAVESVTRSGDEAERLGGTASPSSNGNGAAGQSKTVDDGSVTGRPIYSSMKAKLREALSPTELHIEDVSHEHKGHAGVHKGAQETHFNVVVVSEAFEGQNTVKRHRAIYGLLEDEFKNGLHALSLVTKTPSEMVKA